MLLQAQVTLEVAVRKTFIFEWIEVIQRAVAQFHVIDAGTVAEAGAKAIRMEYAPVRYLIGEVAIPCSRRNISDLRIIDHGLGIKFKYRCATHYGCYLGKGYGQGRQIFFIERRHSHILLEAEPHLRLAIPVQHSGQPVTRVGSIILQRVEEETATIGRHHGQEVLAAIVWLVRQGTLIEYIRTIQTKLCGYMPISIEWALRTLLTVLIGIAVLRNGVV